MSAPRDAVIGALIASKGSIEGQADAVLAVLEELGWLSSPHELAALCQDCRARTALPGGWLCAGCRLAASAREATVEAELAGDVLVTGADGHLCTGFGLGEILERRSSAAERPPEGRTFASVPKDGPVVLGADPTLGTWQGMDLRWSVASARWYAEEQPSCEHEGAKGVSGRLFCLSVAPDRLGCEWTWTVAGAFDRHATCATCGTEIRMHRFVPEGESACSITDGSHLPDGRCECVPLGEIPDFFAPSIGVPMRVAISEALTVAAARLAKDELCDLMMPHYGQLRAPVSCPPNCPARDHVPTVNGVTPYLALDGSVHSPRCALAYRDWAPGAGPCNCRHIVTAGEGNPYDPSGAQVAPQ